MASVQQRRSLCRYAKYQVWDGGKIETSMATYREARENLLIAHTKNTIDCDTFALLYDVNRSKNLDLPYLSYDQFDLDKMCDNECISQFHFWKNDIYVLCEALQIPQQLFGYNRVKFDAIEALCIYLRRLLIHVGIVI